MKAFGFLNVHRLLAIILALALVSSAEVSAASPEGIRKPAPTTKSSSKSSSTKSKGTYSKATSLKSSKKKVGYKPATKSKKAPSRSFVSKKRSRTASPDYTKLPITRTVEVTHESQLEKVSLERKAGGDVFLPQAPEFNSVYRGTVAGISGGGDFVQYTMNPYLQKFVREIVANVRSPHVAVVAVEPTSGRILAIGEKSSSIANLALHSGFPAASLFKLVTTAAALERGAIVPESIINFRGGTYELDQFNFSPDARRDTRAMSVAEALGRSCNPVFSRVALKYLNPRVLLSYANSFGFNSIVNSQLQLPPSRAAIPSDDYELGRTAAGFGAVTISPVHAAIVMAGIANRGQMPAPSFIERVIDPSGNTIYRFEPQTIRQLMQPSSSRTLLQMMTATTTIGTSRREFAKAGRPVLGGELVPAKTGTLKGENPKGLNNWFIASAPLHNPKIAVAVVVVNPGGAASKASHIGRLVLEKYLNN